MTTWPNLIRRASDLSWRILVVLALVAVVVVVGISGAAVFVPALLAVVVVPVGRPLFNRLATRLPASAAAAVVLLVAGAIVVAALWLMVSSVAAEWDEIRGGLDDAAVRMSDWLGDRAAGLGSAQLAEIEDGLQDFTETAVDILVGGVTQGVAALGTLLVGTALFLVIFYFGLRDWDAFQDWVVASTGSGLRERTRVFLDRYSTVLRNYWKGQALIGVFDAVAIGVGLWIIGTPLVVPIAILTFVISFIPYVGAIIAGAFAVLVTLGAGDFGDALWALLLSLVVFNTGENLMRPWLVGDTIEMPTFLVFISSTIGVLVAGAFGAIVAIPLVALAIEFRRIYLTDSPEGA